MRRPRKPVKAAADAELSLEVIGAALGGDGGNRLLSPDQTVSETARTLANRLDSSQDLQLPCEGNRSPCDRESLPPRGNNEAAETQIRPRRGS